MSHYALYADLRYHLALARTIQHARVVDRRMIAVGDGRAYRSEIALHFDRDYDVDAPLLVQTTRADPKGLHDEGITTPAAWVYRDLADSEQHRAMVQGGGPFNSVDDDMISLQLGIVLRAGGDMALFAHRVKDLLERIQLGRASLGVPTVNAFFDEPSGAYTEDYEEIFLVTSALLVATRFQIPARVEIPAINLTTTENVSASSAIVAGGELTLSRTLHGEGGQEQTVIELHDHNIETLVAEIHDLDDWTAEISAGWTLQTFPALLMDEQELHDIHEVTGTASLYAAIDG